MSKIPCGGFKLDENFLGMNENDELSLIGGGGGEDTPYQQLVTDGNGNAKWEDRLAYSETIEWDGNAEGKEIIGGGLAILLKKIPGITLRKVQEGTFNGIPIIDIQFVPFSEDIYSFNDFILAIKDNASFEGTTFPYAGIYTPVGNSPFTMRIPIETIKDEYLPKNYRVVFNIAYDSLGHISGISCNCSYEELKSFRIGRPVSILGSLFDKNEVKQLVYINYDKDSETIHLQFYSGENNRILKLNYKQDGSIEIPAN